MSRRPSVALRGLGRVERVYPAAVREREPALGPMKGAGEHIWVITVVYRVSDAEAAGELEAELTPDRIVMAPPVGCLRCEQVHSPALAAAPCPGEPPGELAYVARGTSP